MLLKIIDNMSESASQKINFRAWATGFTLLTGLALSFWAGWQVDPSTPQLHYGAASLLPAILALALAWISREPLLALITGTVSGALVMHKYNYFSDILLPSFASDASASVLLLYLVLLGALMGVWNKTGATLAFAEYATQKFVIGPRSAKIVAWLLGFLFFQGGTVSSVLVGTSVRPVADKQNVSHEELSCIVDATSSPVAILLAFNAWPVYVSAFLFVPGVAFLADEAGRLGFFFSSIHLSFYALFSVIGTLLLAMDFHSVGGKRMKDATHRARSTGKLDADGAKPLHSHSSEDRHLEHLQSHAVDFLIPLILLITVALTSFFITGSPNVNAAFSVAVITAIGIALLRGASMHDLFTGIAAGFKSVVFGAVILLLAIAIGKVSQTAGAGQYLVSFLGDAIPWYVLPYLLLLLSMGIAFSTGTSWATFAVVFPIAMPLGWEFAQHAELANPELFLSIVFAVVLNGSVFGDQCSPISDTSVLSSMSTGCDLMDHVKSQFPLAIKAMLLAICCWSVVLFFV